MDVYSEADKRLTDFLAWVNQRLKQIQKSVNRDTRQHALFDELTILYKEIDTYSREMYLAMLQEAYDAEAQQKQQRFTEDFLLVILDEPNPFSTVTYSRELERRAERLSEQITAAINRNLQSEDRTNENGVKIPLATEIKKLFQREFNSVTTLLDEYLVEVVDAGRDEAFKDDGVSRVRWVTQMDGRECDYCRSLNGHVFPVNRVPTKPHPRCRCYTVRFD